MNVIQRMVRGHEVRTGDRLPDDGVLVAQTTEVGDDHVELRHARGTATTLIPRQMLIKVERICRVDDHDEARIVHSSSSPRRPM